MYAVIVYVQMHASFGLPMRLSGQTQRNPPSVLMHFEFKPQGNDDCAHSSMSRHFARGSGDTCDKDSTRLQLNKDGMNNMTPG